MTRDLDYDWFARQRSAAPAHSASRGSPRTRQFRSSACRARSPAARGSAASTPGGHGRPSFARREAPAGARPRRRRQAFGTTGGPVRAPAGNVGGRGVGGGSSSGGERGSRPRHQARRGLLRDTGFHRRRTRTHARHLLVRGDGARPRHSAVRLTTARQPGPTSRLPVNAEDIHGFHR